MYLGALGGDKAVLSKTTLREAGKAFLMSKCDDEGGIVLSNDKKPEITKEQSDVAFKFIEALFGDNVEEYWSLISKVDKARVFGMYRQYTSEHGEQLQFKQYVEHYTKAEQAKLYEGLKDNNPGISKTLRYTEEGEAEVHLHPNVIATRAYIVPTQVRVFPLILTIDSEFNQGEITAEWKVRLYTDKLYEFSK